MSHRDRAMPHNLRNLPNPINPFSLVFNSFSLTFAPRVRQISQIMWRRAVPPRHLSQLFRFLITVFRSFSLSAWPIHDIQYDIPLQPSGLSASLSLRGHSSWLHVWAGSDVPWIHWPRTQAQLRLESWRGTSRSFSSPVPFPVSH